MKTYKKPKSLYKNLEEFALDGKMDNGVEWQHQSLNPPVLELPSKSNSWQFFLIPVAAFLTLWLVYPFGDQRSDQELQIKGSFKSWVYVKRGVEVEKWSSKVPLETGDQLQIEVLAPSAGIVLWSIQDRNARMLTDRNFILKHSMPVIKGERKSFANSIVMDDSNQGEVLFVHFCPFDMTGVNDTEFQEKLFVDCAITKHKLRK